MEKYTSPNTGKIRILEIINTGDIDSMVNDLDELTTVITLAPGKSFTQVAFTQDTLEMVANELDSDDGSPGYKVVTLTGSIPQVAASRIATLDALRSAANIVRITTANGDRFVLGTLQSAVVISYIYGVGKTPSDPGMDLPFLQTLSIKSLRI
ncbi:MAG: hypothetical protein R6V49_03225 [Bacteroidales bacterium]